MAKFYKRDYNSMKMMSFEDLDSIEKLSSNDPFLIQTSEIVVEALRRRLEVIRDFFTIVPQPDAYCSHVDCLERKLWLSTMAFNRGEKSTASQPSKMSTLGA